MQKSGYRYVLYLFQDNKKIPFWRAHSFVKKLFVKKLICKKLFVNFVGRLSHLWSTPDVFIQLDTIQTETHRHNKSRFYILHCWFSITIYQKGSKESQTVVKIYMLCIILQWKKSLWLNVLEYRIFIKLIMNK